MSRFWSDIVGTLTPYVPGEQAAMPGLIKLNTNENPYSRSPRVAVAIAQAAESLQLYPDPGSRVLCQAIAETHGLDAGQVFVGNGSDEVLAHVFKALLKHDAPLLFPDVTYSFYPTYCRLFGIDFREVRLDDSLAVRIADYRQPCGAIILPNPNAPTGMLLPLRDIESLLQDHPDQMVVVDEAYGDFGGESAVSLVASYDNLLVVQTFSKSRSLAGLRVGFAMGQRPLIEALETVRDSFNSYPLDRLAQAGALAAWTDRDWFETHRRMVIDERERLADALRATFRRPSLGRQFPARSPSRAAGSTSPYSAEAAKHPRAAFQAPAHRKPPAHHRRHRQAMRRAGGCASADLGWQLIVQRA